MELKGDYQYAFSSYHEKYRYVIKNNEHYIEELQEDKKYVSKFNLQDYIPEINLKKAFLNKQSTWIDDRFLVFTILHEIPDPDYESPVMQTVWDGYCLSILDGSIEEVSQIKPKSPGKSKPMENECYDNYQLLKEKNPSMLKSYPLRSQYSPQATMLSIQGELENVYSLIEDEMFSEKDKRYSLIIKNSGLVLDNVLSDKINYFPNENIINIKQGTGNADEKWVYYSLLTGKVSLEFPKINDYSPRGC